MLEMNLVIVCPWSNVLTAATLGKSNHQSQLEQETNTVTKVCFLITPPYSRQSSNWLVSLKNSYRRLGLLTKLNGVAGGKEKTEVEKQETQEEKELTEEDIEKIKKTLKPGEGLIQRDDEGNVIRVIVGEQKSHDEILDEEPEPVEAKTQVVRGEFSGWNRGK